MAIQEYIAMCNTIWVSEGMEKIKKVGCVSVLSGLCVVHYGIEMFSLNTLQYCPENLQKCIKYVNK